MQNVSRKAWENWSPLWTREMLCCVYHCSLYMLTKDAKQSVSLADSCDLHAWHYATISIVFAICDSDREAVQKLEAKVRSERTSCGEKVSDIKMQFETCMYKVIYIQQHWVVLCVVNSYHAQIEIWGCIMASTPHMRVEVFLIGFPAPHFDLLGYLVESWNNCW